MAPNLIKRDDYLGGAPYAFIDRIPSLKDIQQLDIWEPKNLALIHDDFNIGVLSILSALSIVGLCNLKAEKLATCLTVMTLIYIAFDTLWITIFRSSVKSPNSVLGHHIAVLVVLLDPMMVPVHRVYTAAAMIVEINTTLLILRRRFNLGLWCEIPFALSWVGIRMLWYPIFAVYLVLCAFPDTLSSVYPQSFVSTRIMLEKNDPQPLSKPTLLMWLGICIFQIWWSRPLVRSWVRQIKGKIVPTEGKYL